MLAPCKGCKDRHEACHNECEKYKEWKTYYSARQEAIKRAKEADNEYCHEAFKDLKRG